MASEMAVKNALVNSALFASKIEWDRQRWGLWEQVRFVAMIVLWISAWVARGLLVFLPQHIPTSGLLGIIDSVSQTNLLAVEDDGANRRIWSGQGGGLARSAIGRALSQVLDLVNDIPVTSRKYEFARTLADKMIYDNAKHGGQALKEVNKMALEAGFSRTICLLGNALEGLHRQQQAEAWGWPWRVIRGLPIGAASLSLQCLPLLSTLRSRLGSVLQNQMITPQPMSQACTDDDAETAEKLAQELLWMAQKLQENGAVEAAILHWSSAAGLAGQAVCANTRVQRLLVKLSAFLCSGLVASEVEPPLEVTLKLLLLWLPLLCRSTHGVDGTIFTTAEKHEAERMLEKTIHLLPDADQELVLGIWLREFAFSSSDWPNLHDCYDGWCYSTRKLNFAANQTEDGQVLKQHDFVLDGDNEVNSEKQH